MGQPSVEHPQSPKVEPVPQEDLALAFKDALAISNRHKGRNNLWSALAILSNHVVIAGCAVFSEYAYAYPGLSLWERRGIYTLMVLIIASRMRGFEVLVHEASHNNLFTSPRAHEWFEFTFAFPVFRALKAYRTTHLDHHRYLGDPVRDADIVRMQWYGFDDKPTTLRTTWLLFGLPLTGWLQYEYITTSFIEFWTESAAWPAKFTYWALAFGAVHACNAWREFGWYFLVPFLGILPITRWWAEMSEHAGMDMRGNFGNSRTNDGFWQRWWMHPLNDGLHAVHHLNAQVPFHRLRDAHTELMTENKAFREKNVIAHGLWDTFMQIYQRPTLVREPVVAQKSGQM
ncbi:fatty acid desaturase-domain-containing protein [Mycena rebaudengoi]|nr:fatty acid desaturase-domain-containing protein [Mycena rebaudengoi]